MSKKLVKVEVCCEVFTLEKDVAQRWGLVADMYEKSLTGDIEQTVQLVEIDDLITFQKLVEWTKRYKDRMYSLTDEDRYNKEKRLNFYEPEDRLWLPKGFSSTCECFPVQD